MSLSVEIESSQWLLAFGAICLISVLPNVLLFLIPADKIASREVRHVLLSFAAAALLGDVFLHILPHRDHDHESVTGAASEVVLERHDHSHGHVHGHHCQHHHHHEHEHHEHAHHVVAAVVQEVAAHGHHHHEDEAGLSTHVFWAMMLAGFVLFWSAEYFFSHRDHIHDDEDEDNAPVPVQDPANTSYSSTPTNEYQRHIKPCG